MIKMVLPLIFWQLYLDYKAIRGNFFGTVQHVFPIIVSLLEMIRALIFLMILVR